MPRQLPPSTWLPRPRGVDDDAHVGDRGVVDDLHDSGLDVPLDFGESNHVRVRFAVVRIRVLCHPGNHHLVLRVGPQQDGQEPERVGAPVHGAGHGTLRRWPGREHVRFDRDTRETGRKRRRARHHAGDRCARPDAAALSIPQYAEYKGSGDLKNAATWAYTAPRSTR